MRLAATSRIPTPDTPPWSNTMLRAAQGQTGWGGPALDSPPPTPSHLGTQPHLCPGREVGWEVTVVAWPWQEVRAVAGGVEGSAATPPSVILHTAGSSVLLHGSMACAGVLVLVVEELAVATSLCLALPSHFWSCPLGCGGGLVLVSPGCSSVPQYRCTNIRGHVPLINP